jgi:hypothetical protein
LISTIVHQVSYHAMIPPLINRLSAMWFENPFSILFSEIWHIFFSKSSSLTVQFLFIASVVELFVVESSTQWSCLTFNSFFSFVGCFLLVEVAFEFNWVALFSPKGLFFRVACVLVCYIKTKHKRSKYYSIR